MTTEGTTEVVPAPSPITAPTATDAQPIASSSTLAPPLSDQPPTETASVSNTTDTSMTAPTDPPMTKSALKRQRRQEQYESQKLARRAKEKEKKKTKAAEKRKLIEEGVIERPEKKQKKKGEWDADGNKIEHGARIVLDVGFDELMNEKEVKSMTSQVAYCYAANRNATQPFPLLVSTFSGRLKDAYSRRKDHLNWKGVEWWEDGFEKLYENENTAGVSDEGEGTEAISSETTLSEGKKDAVGSESVKLGVYAGRPRSTAPKSSLIYLTGDSPNVLSSIEPNHTYILGGIVDRNRHKFLCLNKANELGIQHAQLPIGQYLPEMATRKVLTVNQVFEIMVNWVESLRERKEQLREEGKSEEEIAKAEGDWREALRKVMPVRKFDKDGKAKKRAEKKAEKRKQSGENGVYVVELDDEDDDEEYSEDEETDARDITDKETAVEAVEAVEANGSEATKEEK